MLKRCRSIFRIAGALALVGTLGLPPGVAVAELGDCSQPISTGASPVASDCLFILRAAVGGETCDDPCICAPKGSLPTTATDALVCLFEAVGTADMACPCGGAVDLQDDLFLFDVDVDVDNTDIRFRFVDTNYIGAFPQDEALATGDWTAGWTVDLHGNATVWHPATEGTLGGAVPAADGACPAGTTDVGDTALPGGMAGTMDLCELASRYDSDGSTISLTNDNIYRLTGGAVDQGTRIGNGDNEDIGPSTPSLAEVTIELEAGTLLLGGPSEALAITRGSKIEVNGTAANPVVMSSQTWFDDWLAGDTSGTSGRGEWGGLVVTGFGVTNDCNDPTFCDGLVEGFLDPFEYGGLDNSDDSGHLTYLVVRQAGFDIDGNGNELNGITLFGVGWGTEISYVQVHENDDDGIEFFGGAVVVDHAVLTGIADDSIDTDIGFVGGVQFAVIRQAADTGDRGFECNSNQGPSPTPVSEPIFANITTLMDGSLGDDFPNSGAILRGNTGGYWTNGIIQGAGRSCFRLDDSTLSNRAGTLSDPDDGVLQIHNFVIHCPGSSKSSLEGESGVADNEDADVATWYFADANNREIDPRLNDFGYPTGPRLFGPQFRFDPATDVVNADLRDKFVATDYVGAFDQALDPSEGNWTEGWTISLNRNTTVWEPATGGTLAGAVPSADGSCPTGTTDVDDEDLSFQFSGSMDVCKLAARYDTGGTTITLTNDNIYVLDDAGQGTIVGDGDVDDATPASASEVVLEIEPGTLLLGNGGQALAITRGSDLVAAGTAVDPIVMGSRTWFDDWKLGSNGTSGRGEWGGLVITGFGVANQCNDPVSCDALVEGFLDPFPYGGLDNSDDSGVLEYVVVRNAGFDIDGNGNELNGITLFAVGSETQISHVQVHKNDDDGIEFFGGAVVVDHAVLTGNRDDSIDSDLGFGGGVQFAVIKQNDEGADRCFETDSSDTPSDTPVSMPTWANITCLGGRGSDSQDTTGHILRSATGGYLWNGIITGSERSCIRLDDSTLPERAGVLSDPDDGVLTINNYAIDCPNATKGNLEGESGVAGNEDADVQTWFDASGSNLEIGLSLNDIGYPAPPSGDPF